MKNYVLSTILAFLVIGMQSQTKEHKFGITTGAFVQHYNGNLGNSFFKFNTTCFGGGMATFGLYLNKSFDLNLGTSVSDFGYCQTEADLQRIVSAELKCPGCTSPGMGELRSRMISGNIAVKYKFANGLILKENSRFSPYVYFGAGVNHLSDNMKRKCVNVGNHLSLNAGAGVKYTINKRFNVGYNLGVGYFTSKKTYASGGPLSEELQHDEDVIKMEKRKDLYLQNTLFIGIDLF